MTEYLTYGTTPLNIFSALTCQHPDYMTMRITWTWTVYKSYVNTFWECLHWLLVLEDAIWRDHNFASPDTFSKFFPLWWRTRSCFMLYTPNLGWFWKISHILKYWVCISFSEFWKIWLIFSKVGGKIWRWKPGCICFKITFYMCHSDD